MREKLRRLGSCRAVGVLAIAAVLLSVAPSLVFAASRVPASSREGMVVTSQPDATRAGVAMLVAGGNAVDAAIAAALASCVTRPYSTGIGGGAFILIRLANGEVVAIDGRETAPGAADRDMYVRAGVAEDASVYGALAAGTPGIVAGLALALERYGTLSFAEVMQPAIRLARDGFEIGARHAETIEYKRSGFTERFPETARIQFPPPTVTVQRGWRLVQTDLADTLEEIATRGPRAFYEGPIAEAIVAHMKETGGLITREDLAGYEPVVRDAVRGIYRGYEILSFPPPSSGGVALIESLNILEGMDLASHGSGSSASIHRITEALKFAFADRAAFMGDPDFVQVPVERLIAKDYAERLRERINPSWWRRSPWLWFRREPAIRIRQPGLPVDDSGTAHLSVADAAGNAVAITQTINTSYGSGLTVPGTGIVLNNEMDDFAMALNQPNVYGLVDIHGMNAIQSKKRPLSSMTPTIVVKDGETVMVTGSPGGPRIISTTLLSILNVIDFGMDVQQAVSAPRFHQQWIPNKLYLEPEIPDDVVQALRRRGHVVRVVDYNWSGAQAIAVDPQTGWFTGGSDPRVDGLALGP